MAITTSVLGPNSKEITYTGGSAHTALEIANAIGAELATMGWAVHDASARVYTTFCKDGVTPKYVQVFPYTGSGTHVYFRVYEQWNATTHVGTNEAAHHVTPAANAYTSTASVTAGALSSATNSTLLAVNLVNGGSIVLLASNRYALLYGKNNNLLTDMYIHGCVEWSRDSAEANSTPFGFFTQGGILGQKIIQAVFSNTNATSLAANCIYPVKTRGATAADAAKHVTVSASTYDTVIFGATGTPAAVGKYGLKDVIPTANNPTTNLPSSYTFEVVNNKPYYTYNGNIATADQNSGCCLVKESVLGRIYGLKLIAGNTNSWVDGDTVGLAVDNDGFQVQSGGTVSQHHIAAIDGLPKFKLAVPV
jgi:hypothetical protein